MRFAKGDLVRIKSQPEILQQLNENREMTGTEDGRLSFPPEMEVYCGMYCTISMAFHNHDGFERYLIDADDREWYWSVNMFEEDYSQEDVDVQYSIDILFDAME